MKVEWYTSVLTDMKSGGEYSNEKQTGKAT